MASTVAESLLKRWQDAGLDESVAVLFRGSDKDDFGSTPEELDEARLPRAEFIVGDESVDVHAVGFRVRSSIVTFRIYSLGSEIEDHLNSIESLVDNSELADTDPAVIDVNADGFVTIQFNGRVSRPVDKNVSCGEVDFLVSWQKPFAVPS